MKMVWQLSLIPAALNKRRLKRLVNDVVSKCVGRQLSF